MQIVFDATGLFIWNNWSPEDLNSKNNILGGTEIAIINMAKELAQLENDVIIFRNSNTDEVSIFDGVHYANSSLIEKYLSENSVDVLITVGPNIGNWNYDCVDTKLRVHWVHTSNMYIPYEYMQKVDLWFYLSETQKNRLLPYGLNATNSYKTKNGINSELYKDITPYEDREHKIIYITSPDRGLHHFINIYNELYKKDKALKAEVYYDVENYLNKSKYDMNLEGDRVHQILSASTKIKGSLEIKGHVPHKDIIDVIKNSKAVVIPADLTAPGETFGMSILEACACGTPVVTSNRDCIPELWGDAVEILDDIYDYSIWVDKVSNVINNKDIWDRISLNAYNKATINGDYDWYTIASNWVKLFEDKIG